VKTREGGAVCVVSSEERGRQRGARNGGDAVRHESLVAVVGMSVRWLW